MSTPTDGRILVALKAMLSTPIVNGRHSVFQVLSPHLMSALKVAGIMVATVDRNVNSHS